MGFSGQFLRSGALLFLIAGSILLSGCRSDVYYQNRAVERARKFLLANAPELSVEQIYFVKYNSPILLTAPILDKRGKIEREMVTAEQRQICVTWAIPGMDKYYLVFGSSSGRMEFWYPNRLIRKTFRQFSPPLNAAMETARKYALNYLYEDMSVTEFNEVRFYFPYVIETKFEYVLDPTGNASQEEIDKVRTGLEKKTQYSLVWKFPERGEAMVFCGASQPDLTGWNVNFAGWVPFEELDAETIEVVRTPEDATTPIEVPDESEEAAEKVDPVTEQTETAAQPEEAAEKRDSVTEKTETAAQPEEAAAEKQLSATENAAAGEQEAK